jgi:hypothetical protein
VNFMYANTILVSKQIFISNLFFLIHLKKEICLYFLHCYFDEAPLKNHFTPRQNNNIKTIANLNFNTQ